MIAIIYITRPNLVNSISCGVAWQFVRDHITIIQAMVRQSPISVNTRAHDTFIYICMYRWSHLTMRTFPSQSPHSCDFGNILHNNSAQE